MRPMDDTFMRCLFKDNVALTELVLRIILNKKDLSVTKIETQADMKRVTGARSICLDAAATDSEGVKYDIKVQRASDGARPNFLFFVVTNWSVVLYCSKVKGVALRDTLLGDNNNYLRSKNDADLSSVEGLFRPSTIGVFLRNVKRELKPVSFVCLTAAFTYLVSDCFGVTLYNTAPFLFIFLGLGYNSKEHGW